MHNPYSRPIDNLSAFTHPDFGQKFKYMNDREAIGLAQTVLDKCIESGFETIVVIESGTSPLVQIIERLRAFGNAGLKFVQLKIPRDPHFDLQAWFETYLSKRELAQTVTIDGRTMSRRQALAAACDKRPLEQLTNPATFNIYDSIADRQAYDNTLTEHMRHILSGTTLSAVFGQPFLLFDEYINSGTVLRTFNTLARLFTDKPQYKVSAYCIFVDDATKYDKIAFALYDKRSELTCYQKGAYPYENRIDIIGYYYFVAPYAFEKVTLAELYAEFADKPHNDPAAFYDRMWRAIQTSDITKAFKDALAEDQVRAYVTPYDIVRHLLKQLEYQANGKTKYWDLLDQAFELYAPAWSPMPVKNHLDYWNGFALINAQSTALAQQFVKDYMTYRDGIFCDLLQRMTAVKIDWDMRIDHVIKEMNL